MAVDTFFVKYDIVLGLLIEDPLEKFWSVLTIKTPFKPAFL